MIGFGVLLLAVNIVPRKWWGHFTRWVPRTVREAVLKPQGDKMSAFYTTRTSLNELRGGIAKEIDNTTVLYAAWPGASVAGTSLTQEQRKKVKRLLLRNPNNVEIPKYAALQGWEVSKVQSDANHAVATFRTAGTDVRWLDAPLTSITIGDPDTRHAWARVEVQFFAEIENWQNYLIRKKDNKRAYAEILSAFNKMWGSEWASEPPPSLLAAESDENRVVVTQQRYAITWFGQQWYLGTRENRRNYWTDETGAAGLFLVGNISVTTIGTILVESVILELGGNEYATDWKSQSFPSPGERDLQIQLPLAVQRGKATAQLQAIVDGEPYLGERFTLNLPEGKQVFRRED